MSEATEPKPNAEAASPVNAIVRRDDTKCGDKCTDPKGCYAHGCLVEVGLDERMIAAGMIPISEMLERNPLGKFSACAEVTDLENFEKWLKDCYREFLQMQVRMTLAKKEDDELFEWTLSHAACLGSVLANFRQATGRSA